MRLDHELPFFLIVTCPNLNHLHEDVYVQYIVCGKGIMIVEPSYQQVMRAQRYFSDVPVIPILTVCRLCRAKGVKGMSHFNAEEVLEKILKGEQKQLPPPKEEGDDGA